MRELRLISSNNLPEVPIFGRDIALKDYRKYLGITQGDIYYDATNGLFPNALAALSGTINDNHHLYLILSEHYPKGDPDHARYIDFGSDILNCHNYFNTRLHKIITSNREKVLKPLADDTEALPNAFFTANRALLLGQRGVGKSTLLAQKIQHFFSKSIAPLVIITPFYNNRGMINQLPKEVTNSLIFLPPDAALRNLPTAAHVFIDEAAALAPQQLLALTAHYENWTLATTTDGYEGSANQFCLKTLVKLDLSSEVVFSLNKHHRFQQQDALARTIATIFLTDINSPISSETIGGDISYQEIFQQTLFKNETLLHSVWQLFSTAHYRTTPEDLKRLLDIPSQRLWIAKSDNRVIAVLQIHLECPLPKTLITEIIAGKRRPQGRILMQQLLLRCQNAKWGKAPLARIERIAVAEKFRRQGIASKLINTAKSELDCQLGTSFAFTPELDTFWNQLGFTEMWRADYTRARNHAPTSLRLQN